MSIWDEVINEVGNAGEIHLEPWSEEETRSFRIFAATRHLKEFTKLPDRKIERLLGRMNDQTLSEFANRNSQVNDCLRSVLYGAQQATIDFFIRDYAKAQRTDKLGQNTNFGYIVFRLVPQARRRREILEAGGISRYRAMWDDFMQQPLNDAA